MRAFTTDENPIDLLKKIDDFINNDDNTTIIMELVNDVIVKLDKLEVSINNLDEQVYREEMLGYVTMSRNYIINLLDALDSMMDM